MSPLEMLWFLIVATFVCVWMAFCGTMAWICGASWDEVRREVSTNFERFVEDWTR